MTHSFMVSYIYFQFGAFFSLLIMPPTSRIQPFYPFLEAMKEHAATFNVLPHCLADAVSDAVAPGDTLDANAYRSGIRLRIEAMLRHASQMAIRGSMWWPEALCSTNALAKRQKAAKKKNPQRKHERQHVSRTMQRRRLRWRHQPQSLPHQQHQPRQQQPK